MKQGGRTINKDLIEEILSYSGEEGIAVATVVKAKGSSPREPGAGMLVYPDGEISGTVGGGSAEAAVIEKALDLIDKGGSCKLEFDMSNEEAADEGQLCGGKAEIFIESLDLD